MTTKRTSHSVYNLNYHIVLVTKYRHAVLVGAIETFVEERAREICTRYAWELLEIEVMPDHLHLFVSAPPKIAPLTIAATLKSILAVDVFRAFPTLKKHRFWGSGLWTGSTYFGSAGTVSAETIKRYIAPAQRAPEVDLRLEVSKSSCGRQLNSSHAHKGRSILELFL